MAKKQHNCDPDDPAEDHCGDYWDHVAYDPEHKLVLAVIPGARTIENAEALVAEEKRRTGDPAPALMTSDEYPAYETAIEAAFGEPLPPPPRPKPGRPRIVAERRLPEEVVYATVHKHREGNRVVAVDQRQVFGTSEGLRAALDRSTASHRVNTSFAERQNETDRGRNAPRGSEPGRTAVPRERSRQRAPARGTALGRHSRRPTRRPFRT